MKNELPPWNYSGSVDVARPNNRPAARFQRHRFAAAARHPKSKSPKPSGCMARVYRTTFALRLTGSDVMQALRCFDELGPAGDGMDDLALKI
jgi:hypothetical protein